MENFRISTRNNINSEIKQTENIIKRNKDTIDRLRNSQTNFEFNKKQIEILRENFNIYFKKINYIKYNNIIISINYRYIF